MLANHTPGPWCQEHRKGRGGMWNTEVFCAKGETIATLAWYPRPEVNGVVGTYREANASLIAAAPELLTVAEHVFVLLTTKGVAEVFGQEWCDKAHAAIRKAYGSQS